MERYVYRENLLALGGESCSSNREVTVAFNFISERIVITPLVTHTEMFTEIKEL
jgi:hypothetical protein